jgi:hypothetical protein
MVVIDDGDALARALALPLDPRMAALLLERRRQLGADFGEHCRFVLVGPLDRPCWLEEALGFSPFQNPADGTWYGDEDYSPGFDALEDHGFCFELTFDMTSDFTHVLLVENAPGVNKDLLDFCRAYANQHA